jgi:hypothetical protein
MTSFLSSANTTSFEVGQLIITYGTISVVDGFNHGDLILKIVDCEVNGIRQGGRGQRYCAPAQNCRLVVSSDNVKLMHFKHG